MDIILGGKSEMEISMYNQALTPQKRFASGGGGQQGHGLGGAGTRAGGGGDLKVNGENKRNAVGLDDDKAISQ